MKGSIRQRSPGAWEITLSLGYDAARRWWWSSLIETAKGYDTHCIVMGLEGSPAHNIQALNVLRHVPRGQIVGSWDEAKSTAARLLG